MATTTLTTAEQSALVRIECSIAQNRADREAAFRLVYRSYLRSGLIEPNPFEMRVTPFHLEDTTQVFVARVHSSRIDGEIVATLSLVEDGSRGLPMESIFQKEVEQRRNQGLSISEVTCFADRRRNIRRFLPMFQALGRMMSQYARSIGIDQLLVTVHPRHVRFYSRYLGFDVISDPCPHPYVRGHLAVAMCMDFEQIDRQPPSCYDIFFGERIPADQLIARPMEEMERKHFEPMAAHCDPNHPMCLFPADADHQPREVRGQPADETALQFRESPHG
jgi:hypothetical protein